jgi:hypothetical protein
MFRKLFRKRKGDDTAPTPPPPPPPPPPNPIVALFAPSQSIQPHVQGVPRRRDVRILSRLAGLVAALILAFDVVTFHSGAPVHSARATVILLTAGVMNGLGTFFGDFAFRSCCASFTDLIFAVFVGILYVVQSVLADMNPSNTRNALNLLTTVGEVLLILCISVASFLGSAIEV